ACSYRELTRWSLSVACAIALTSPCACTFDTTPWLEHDRAAANKPVAEHVSSGDWLDTLDESSSPAPAPTPNGRMDDPLRPQQTAAPTDPPLAAATLTPPRFRKLETRHLGQ